MGTERKQFYEDRGEIRVTIATIKQRLYVATRSERDAIFVVIDYGSLQEIICKYCTKDTVSDQYQNCWHEYYCQFGSRSFQSYSC